MADAAAVMAATLLLAVVLLAPNGLTSVLQRLQRKSQP